MQRTFPYFILLTFGLFGLCIVTIPLDIRETARQITSVDVKGGEKGAREKRRRGERAGPYNKPWTKYYTQLSIVRKEKFKNLFETILFFVCFLRLGVEKSVCG